MACIILLAPADRAGWGPRSARMGVLPSGFLLAPCAEGLVGSGWRRVLGGVWAGSDDRYQEARGGLLEMVGARPVVRGFLGRRGDFCCALAAQKGEASPFWLAPRVLAGLGRFNLFNDRACGGLDRFKFG